VRPRAATAVCSVKSRRDGLIIARHAVLGCEECVDQSRKGRLNYGRIACAIRNFLNSSDELCAPACSGVKHRNVNSRVRPLRLYIDDPVSRALEHVRELVSALSCIQYVGICTLQTPQHMTQ